MSTLAIDIGGTKIALGIIDNDSIQDRRQIPTPKAISAETFAAEILQQCQDWLSKVERIGISTTGLVTEKGISAINPDTLAFPTPFPLHHELEIQSNKTVSMLNDAQAAAWFEYLQLPPTIKNMAYVTVSTGVGGGLIIDGKLHKGQSNFAGHIGHTVIDLNGPECGCGQKGCVEALASGTAINQRAKKDIHSKIDNIELFKMAESNDQAKAIIKQSADAIAALCCNLKASLDLDIIVLGGGVGLAKGYLQRVIETINTKPVTFRVVDVQAARGDYDACLLGAAFQFKEVTN